MPSRLAEINSGEATLDRHPKAALNPQEVAALRRLRVDPDFPISLAHRQLFPSMAMVFTRGEECRLTVPGAAGWRPMPADGAYAARRRA